MMISEEKTFAMTLTKASKRGVMNALEQGMAIAELEPLGVSTRTISVIEDQLGFIYIEDLLTMTWPDFRGTPNLGAAAVEEVKKALSSIHLLTDCVKRNYLRSIIPNINRAKMIRNIKPTKTNEKPRYDPAGREIE